MESNERTTSIQYEAYLGDAENDAISGSLNNKVILPKDVNGSGTFEEKATKQDCLVASASGVLTGFLDVFWVVNFSLRDAQTIGREQVSRFVVSIASAQGCTKTSLEDSIRFLEKKYPNPSDKLTPEFGGGLQHHLRDFSHHASPVGLICSILVQFTEKGYGTDTSGKMINPDIPPNGLIGKNFEEKILYGVIYWVFHLISDMAGSSSNPGAGTGIPGPILSLMKEMSSLPIFQDKTVSYKDSEIAFSTWISKLFNGTAFQHTGYKDLIRFDLRTEIGVFDFAAKQAIPVIINQCVVRAFYFINRLYHELKNRSITSFDELERIDPGRVLPFNNRCVDRMVTISSGTFSAVDAIDAAIHAKIEAATNSTAFMTEFLLRINFVGIANFAIAVKNDARNIYADIKNAITGEENKYKTFNYIETQTIEINADMDNTAIYRYRFDELLQNVKHSRKHLDERNERVQHKRQLVFDIRTQEFDDYSELVSYNESWIRYALEKTIITIFEQNNIPYEIPKLIDKHRFFDFIQTEQGRRIGYVFKLGRLHRGLKQIFEELKGKTDVDEVRFFFAINIDKDSNGYLSMLNQISEQEYGSYLKFATLKDFFDSNIREGEYEIFKNYVDEFNEKARNVIAYKAIVIPTGDEVASFRKRESETLKAFDYESMLPTDIYEEQKRILRRNYLERQTYRTLIGESDCADSFITSEWNYKVNKATGVLDQTGVVAGYLKSVEQLLYLIIRLSINKNKFIRLKNGDDGEFNSNNEEYVNSTLGSLTYFVKNNGDILDVNSYMKRYIVDQLFDWINKERNGYFHKDNLHDEKRVDEIRKQTFLLYYLILGGFSIKDDEFEKIGIVDTSKSITIDEKTLYQKFKAWASPVILYDVPQNTKAVGFVVTAFKGRPWEITLQALAESTETDERWNWNQIFSTSYMSNNFCWENSLDWKNGLDQIICFVDRLMNEDDLVAKKLKSAPKVVIGSYKVHKVFINEG